MTKAPGEPRPFSWKGITGGFTGCWAPSAELLREWNSSHPIVDAFATSTIVVIAAVIPIATAVVVIAAVIAIATPVVIIAAVTAVVSKAIDVADESQLPLDLRPL